MRTSDVTQLMDLALGLWFPFVRIMAFLRYVPVLDNSALTVRVRIILSLALAIIITPLIPHPVPHDLISLNSLILTVEQILWGMLFGLMFQFLFLALQLAGQILSFNMGMSMAVMNDPSSGASTTVLAELINVYAILLFFAMDGHLLLVSVFQAVTQINEQTLSFLPRLIVTLVVLGVCGKWMIIQLHDLCIHLFTQAALLVH